jgi:hypothetical protein
MGMISCRIGSRTASGEAGGKPTTKPATEFRISPDLRRWVAWATWCCRPSWERHIDDGFRNIKDIRVNLLLRDLFSLQTLLVQAGDIPIQDSDVLLQNDDCVLGYV